jgi:ribonucleoside-diphosphate reductase beta chain
MNGISVSTASFDFFSQVGNGYLMGNAEAMEDEDYTKFAKSKISK